MTPVNYRNLKLYTQQKKNWTNSNLVFFSKETLHSHRYAGAGGFIAFEAHCVDTLVLGAYSE